MKRARALGLTLLLAALALAALAYAQPSVMIQISEMIWSCFG
jgi:hypothetical protein